MAAYTTPDDVASEAKIPNGFSDGPSPPATNPTFTKVANMIAEEEAKLNARISRKYVLPITQAINKLILRGIVLAIVVERVRSITEVKTGSAVVQQAPGYKSPAQLAKMDVELIVKGSIPLTGETSATSREGIQTHYNANPTKCIPKWHRNREQW